MDVVGFFGTPLSWVLAAVFGIVGAALGYYIAKQNRWGKIKTGLFIAAITVVGAVAGFLAGEVLVGFIKAFLAHNPVWFLKLPPSILYLLGFSGDVVLGGYPGYVNLAQNIGACFYGIPQEIWQELSKDEQWQWNKRFLDNMIAQGKDFICSENAYKVPKGRWLYQEIEYLLSKGYKIVEQGYKLIKK